MMPHVRGRKDNMKHKHIFMRFPEGREKAFSLTFDDGTVEDEAFIEMMGKLSIRGTFNINSGLFSKPDTHKENFDVNFFPVKDIQTRLSYEDALRVYSKPYIEVASHGYRHADPSVIDPASLTWDIMQDRSILEGMFGYPITGYAYPQGAYNNTAVDILKNCGFEYARTVNMCERFDLPTDYMRLAPTCGFASPNFEKITDSFIEHKAGTCVYFGNIKSIFFNVFAHGYEFGINKERYHIFEECLKKLAHREDVWYATNIEVVRYMKAFDSLIFTLDRTKVYNPSALPLWLAANGEVICVGAGETVAL